MRTRSDSQFYRRKLPHARASNATYFVTWRLHANQHDLTPSERTIVAQTIQHFHNVHYELTAYVVMNDHVHVLVTPYDSHQLEGIVRSWKSFSSRKIREMTNRSNPLWQAEYFDRIVRNEGERLRTIQYIQGNPRKRWPDVTSYDWLWVAAQFR